MSESKYTTPQKNGMADHYAVMGVSSDADAGAIRSAFKKLSLQWHPDKNSSAEAEARYKDLVSAKEILLDQEKRRQYDAILQGAAEAEAGAAAANARESRSTAKQVKGQPKEDFNFEKVKQNIATLQEKDGLKRTLIDMSQRPSWVSPNVNYSDALVPVDQTAVVESNLARKYEYTREEKNGVKHVATLCVDQNNRQTIFPGHTMESDKAAVELAKQSGWKGLSAPITHSKERLDNLKRLCEAEGLKFATYDPANKHRKLADKGENIAKNNEMAQKPANSPKEPLTFSGSGAHTQDTTSAITWKNSQSQHEETSVMRGPRR